MGSWSTKKHTHTHTQWAICSALFFVYINWAWARLGMYILNMPKVCGSFLFFIFIKLKILNTSLFSIFIKIVNKLKLFNS